MKSIQYTIRNVPPEVDKELRALAKRQAKSFNQTVVDALRQQTGYTSGDTARVYDDLDWFFGSGQIGAAEQAVFDAQHTVHQEDWPGLELGDKSGAKPVVMSRARPDVSQSGRAMPRLRPRTGSTRQHAVNNRQIRKTDDRD